MKLDRMDEMETFLSEKLRTLTEKRVELLIKNYQKQDKKICNTVSDILRGLANSRQGYLIISYLRSSIVTGSNEFLFAFYSDEPYVEEEPDKVIWQMDDLFRDTEDDMIEVDKMLRERFIRILSSEIETIRRSYMIKLYEKCKKLFQQIVENIEDKEGIKVYYGEYMGEMPTEIGVV